jgi:hypothetical protein
MRTENDMNICSTPLFRVLCGWVLLTSAPFLSAQLAITEVMSSASTNLGATRVLARSDFWELTNFGTNTLDLTGYHFNDSAGIAGAESAMFNGLSIGPGESIIFAKEETNTCCKTAAEFRAWWGEGQLPANLQIHFYLGRGFNSDLDAVQFWHVAGGSTTLVQRVELYQARRGYSFTYHPETGELESFSEAGAGNAFQAVETDDVGSPGFTMGPVPITITHQPQSLTVDGGSPATFTVQAGGLPKPHFQWRFEGAPIDGAGSNIFEISTAQPIHAGSYTVVLTNGFMSLTSEPATLQVNTNPSPPLITSPPADLVVTPNQTAIFRVTARGYPVPTKQWRFNGADIPGATNTVLFVPNVTVASTGIYSVYLQNTNGSTNASAVLFLRPKPYLKITEMMGATSTNSTISGRGDWWELTNFDTNAVNLRGYRFDDAPGVLDGAVIITNEVIIQPGESVLFIQDMTPELFTTWWGEENLPENVQFIHYAGNGISAGFDTITLWNATALAANDLIDRAEYVHLNPDDTPVRGISLTFWADGFWEFGTNSIMDQWGTIKAAASEDIGSPGYVANHPPRPRALQILRDAQGVHLTWKTKAGLQYELLGKDDLTATNWTSLSHHPATDAVLTITDATATNTATRFYRLRVVPDPE